MKTDAGIADIRQAAAPAPAWWGLREVVVAALVTLVASTLLASLVLTASGAGASAEASMFTTALLQTTLWIGMAAGLAVALRSRPTAFFQAVRLRLRPVDIPIGIGLGVASQLLLVPIVSWPWARVLGRSTDQLREPACQLAAKADDHFGIAALVVITVLGAPFVEEVFFRGFVQRGLTNRFGMIGGAVGTAAVFGTIHYQLLQLPALVAFGLVLGSLTARTGRLGPAIVTHAAFNATTVVSLVLLSTSIDERCGAVLGALR